MLDLLAADDQPGVEDIRIGVFVHQFLVLLDEPFHAFALLSPPGLSHALEDSFEALDMLFGFAQMVLERLL